MSAWRSARVLVQQPPVSGGGTGEPPTRGGPKSSCAPTRSLRVSRRVLVQQPPLRGGGGEARRRGSAREDGAIDPRMRPPATQLGAALRSPQGATDGANLRGRRGARVRKAETRASGWIRVAVHRWRRGGCRAAPPPAGGLTRLQRCAEREPHHRPCLHACHAC